MKIYSEIADSRKSQISAMRTYVWLKISRELFKFLLKVCRIHYIFIKFLASIIFRRATPDNYEKTEILRLIRALVTH